MIDINYVPSINDVDYHHLYKFNDFSLFKNSIENRPTTKSDGTFRAKVYEYYRLIKKGEWDFDATHLDVSIHTKEILNGGTRFAAMKMAMEKGIEIPYFLVRFTNDDTPEKTTRLIWILNNNSHWQIDDHINTWVEQGIESYTYLKKFCFDKAHSMLHSKNRANYGKGALIFGQTYNQFKETYKKSDWVITDKDKKMAEARYEQIVRIIKSLCFDSSDDYWIPIAEAWYKITSEKSNLDKLKSLSDGYETFYEYLYDNYKLMGTNKTKEWLSRFGKAIQDCYEAKFK